MATSYWRKKGYVTFEKNKLSNNLINNIFSGNRINDLSNEEISTRVILATTNKIVRYYNDCILNLLDGEKKNS